MMKSRLWYKIGLLVVLGLAVHLLLPQITSLEHSWNVLLSLETWAVGLAFISQFLSYLGSGYLLQAILGLTHQSVKLFRSTLIVLGAASVGMVAGGILGSSAAIYRWTSQDKAHPESATLASVLPPVFNNIILVLVALFGVIHLLLIHDLSRSQLIEFCIVVLTLSSVIGFVILALSRRNATLKVVSWASAQIAGLRRKPFDPGSLKATLDRIFSVWDTLRTGAWQAPTTGAILNVFFDILTLFFLFIAAGQPVSPGVLLAGYGLPLLLGKVAFMIPGGVGVVEGSMALLYTGLGVPNSITVVVVLGYRLTSFWLPSLAGFPAAAFLSKNKANI